MKEQDRDMPVYGIAVAAQLTGLPEATLRLFEAKGLLSPARSTGGTRRYSDADIGRVRRAAELRTEGVNITGIRHVLNLQDANADLQGVNADLQDANADLRAELGSRRDGRSAK